MLSYPIYKIIITNIILYKRYNIKCIKNVQNIVYN